MRIRISEKQVLDAIASVLMENRKVLKVGNPAPSAPPASDMGMAPPAGGQMGMDPNMGGAPMDMDPNMGGVETNLTRISMRALKPTKKQIQNITYSSSQENSHRV